MLRYLLGRFRGWEGRASAEGLGGARWGGVNGLEVAAVTPPPGLFTRGAFGNPNNPLTPIPVPATR